MRGRGKQFALLTLAFLVCATLYNDCSQLRFASVNGTVLGNPLGPTEVASQLLFDMCGVINRCFPQVTYTQCQQGVLATTGLGPQLGLSGNNGTYSTIVGADQSGALTTHMASLDSCESAINNLSCGNPLVQGAYNPSNTNNPFSGVSSMIPNQTSTCGSIFSPAPTGWTQLANTQLQNVCPASTSQFNFSFYCQYVISNWNGGIADTKRNRLLMWGGGSGYYGNEVYSLDMGTQALTRLNNPSPLASSTTCTETLSDGTPNTRSDYDGLTYISQADLMFSYGGYLASQNPCGTSATWVLNLSSLQWQSMDPHNGGTPVSMPGVVSDYDPNTNLVFLNDTSNLWSYDYSTNTYAKLDVNGSIDYHMTGVIDPVMKLFIIVGGKGNNNGGLKVYDISSTSQYVQQDWTNQVVGCDSLMSAPSPGLAYDAVLDKIVGWSGGNIVYVFDPNTKACSAVSYSGGPPSQQGHGTFGRFRYFPSINAFGLVNDWQQNAFMLQL